MMTINLDELRKVAESATPGPWEWEEPSKENWPTADESLVQSDGDEVVLMGWGYDASGTIAEDVDRAHIATFDPPTVLALLSRLEQAEQDRDEWRGKYDEAETALIDGEAQLDRVREVHRPVSDPFGVSCAACIGDSRRSPYPCDTIRALDGDGLG